MQEGPKLYKPTIWRRLLIIALISAIVPIAILALVTVLAPAGPSGSGNQLSSQVSQETKQQLVQTAEARALGINTRLARIGYSVKLLGSYAEEVLISPAVFAERIVPAKPAEGEAAAEEGTASVGQTAIDNPLFYTQGEDGAIRKLINDDKSAVYFAATATGEFSAYDLQRLHASAILDPLLIEPVASEPLVLQSFMLTHDKLLRTYPFLDISLWPPDKDLSKPGEWWNPDKANADGLLWTAPYFSIYQQRWVTACITACYAGDRVVAVVGCEIDLAKLTEETLDFSLGENSISWLMKPYQRNAEEPLRWLVMSAQDTSQERLGIIPFDMATAPTEKDGDKPIFEEADLLGHGRAELVANLKQQIDSGTTNVGTALPAATAIDTGQGDFIIIAPIPQAGWIIGGIVRNPAVATLENFETGVESWVRQRMLIVLGVAVLAVLLAFGLAWFEANRIVQPLKILTDKVRLAAVSRKTSSVAMADEGEIGALAQVIQQLIDKTTERPNNHAPVEPVSAPADEPSAADDA
ncbi:cache domain-containing protein [bacterium]|nr:cache domain-containing protein [bacterium]